MDIAIIGMSGRFPLADTIDDFYRNLSEGTDTVRPVSEKRLRDTAMPFKNNHLVFGFLEDIDKFDHEFFNISLGEAQNMDPHQRLVLENVYHTFENAGYSMDDINGRNISVFAGDRILDYFELAERFDPTLVTGNMKAAIAGRVAQFFNLRGQAVMVDTTCSSTLVALHLACNDLALKESDMALVCGASLHIFPPVSDNQTDVGITAPDGKAKAFSASANGTAAGEAVAAVLLKPLTKALEDKDIIHAVIKGTATNQDASLSASLTAPSSRAQAEVIQKAWNKSGIDPQTISYIETHGTGTKLGDPIEVEGIRLAFEPFAKEKQFCAISSVKSNIGHTDAVAGLSGLIKAVLSLKHRKLFPSLHFDEPNPFIDFKNSPVYVNDELKVWGADHPRRAGVSSFGLSGTNCHVVLEEAPEMYSDAESPGRFLFTFSAHTRDGLKANVESQYQFLNTSGTLPLENVAFTMNYGRKHFNHRFAVIAGSRNELLEKLQNPVPGGGTKREKVFFIFSDSSEKVSEKELKEFCEEDKDLSSIVSQCMETYRSSSPSVYYFQFILQYSLFKLLESKGVSSKTLIGDSFGKIIISAITGKEGLRNCLEKADQYVPSEDNDIMSKCETLLAKQSGGPVIFMEMGYSGPIGLGIRSLLTGQNLPLHTVVGMPSGEDHLLLHYIKELYLANYDLDWKKLYEHGKKTKVELSSYRFNKKRCWLRDEGQARVDEWFHQLEWVEDASPDKITSIEGKTLLVLHDDRSFATELTAQLKANGCTSVLVTHAGKFEISEDGFLLDFNDGEHFRRMESELNEREIDGIVDLVDHKSDPSSAVRVEYLFHLAKSFEPLFNKKEFVFFSVTQNSCAVHEHLSEPHSASSTAFLKALLSEFPGLKAGSIDFDQKTDYKERAAIIIKEVTSDPTVRFSAYRSGERFVQKLSPVSVDRTALLGKANFLSGRNYLITGGNNGIGLEVARFISKQAHCHLIILGRTVYPPKAQWKDIVREQRTSVSGFNTIKAFVEIENTGSELSYFSVDVSDKAQMVDVFAKLRLKIENIDGILHCAGTGFEEKALAGCELEDFNNPLAPKIEGTVNLSALAEPLRPRFFVCFSSLNAIVPQRYSLGYTVANAFEDAFCSFMAPNDDTTYISVNWPGWSETGMSFRKGNIGPESDNPLKQLSTEEGLLALQYALALQQNNICIADVDLSSFRINPFFKIDHAEATESSAESISADQSPDANEEPQDLNIENVILSIWTDVLKSESIGLDDDFFEIGGHSLNGTQIMNRIEKAIGVSLEFDDLLDYYTVRDLAAHISGILAEEGKQTREGPQPVPVMDSYELSYAQKNFWMLSQFEKSKNATQIRGYYHIKGPLNIMALEHAFAKMIQRHEILRTQFIMVDGEPRQKVLAPDEIHFSINEEDKRAESFNNTEDYIRALEQPEVRFNLSKAPLFDVRLISIKETEYLIGLTLNHIISDGWSMEIMLSEIMNYYNTSVRGEGKEPEPLKIQYKDYAAWLNQLLSEEYVEEHRSYWLNKLGGELPDLQLPLDKPRTKERSWKGSSYTFEIDKEDSDLLQKISNERSVTMFITLQSLLKMLFYKYGGQEDIILGSPVSGRIHQDLEDQLGNYLNIVALRDTFSATMKVLDFIGQVKQTTVEAYEHQIYPYDKLVGDLKLDRNAERVPIFDAGLSWQNYGDAGFQHNVAFDELEVNEITPALDTSKHTIWFYGGIQEGKITFTIQYNTDLFYEETIRKIASDFRSLVQSFTTQQHLNIHELIEATLDQQEKQEQDDFLNMASASIDENF